MRTGYTLMTEQAGPKDLVGYAAGAEKAATVKRCRTAGSPSGSARGRT